ncbi:pro-neuregulin-4, membrane-bound isoform [Thomomys bottae]
MSTDHEEPCGPEHRSFCLNGGICYVIPTVASPFCRCVENYTGARCEEVFLPSLSVQSRSNVPAGVVALAVLVTVAFAALYFLCRRGRPPQSPWNPCEASLVEAGTPGTSHCEYHRGAMPHIGGHGDMALAWGPFGQGCLLRISPWIFI